MGQKRKPNGAGIIQPSYMCLCFALPVLLLVALSISGLAGQRSASALAVMKQTSVQKPAAATEEEVQQAIEATAAPHRSAAMLSALERAETLLPKVSVGTQRIELLEETGSLARKLKKLGAAERKA